MIKAIIAYLAMTGVALAQMAPPYVTGEGAFEQPTTVRCMEKDTFINMLKTKGLRIIIVNSTPEKVNKVILTNEEGSVLVANIFDFGRVCVLDIIDNAAFSKEFKFEPREKEPEEGKNP